MKEIQLSRGMAALIDDEDFKKVSQYKWSILEGRNTYYAEQKRDLRYRHLHRYIMNTPKDLIVDHKDGNGLNCQKINMRNCTYAENCQNRKQRNKKKYGYQGVFSRAEDKHYAGIRYKREQIHLGVFSTAENAALAYNKKALELYGDDANLNIISIGDK